MTEEPPSSPEPPQPTGILPGSVAQAPPPGPMGWQAPAAAAGPQRQRTTLASAAGILLLVLGTIGLLIGLAVIAGGALVGQVGTGAFSDVPGFPTGAEAAVGGFVVIVGGIIVIYSVAYIVSGIGVLRTRDWGRVLGIVLAIVSGLIWISGLTSAGDSRGAFLVPLALVIVHAYVIFALWFRWRSA
jgi:hypothetical protein